jgi:hypothetical protein
MVAAFASLAAARGGAPEAAAPFPAGMADRLAALGPEDAEGYLLLAEDLLEAGDAAGARSLARRLLALACVLDEGGSGGGGVSASACMALASIAPTEADRAWLLAVAAGAGARPTAAAPAAPAGADREASWHLAVAIAMARAGDGAAAGAHLKRPGVAERWVSVADGVPEVRRLVAEAVAQPACAACRNRRWDRVPEGREGREAGGADIVICARCGGNPGPRLTEEAMRESLALEARLLGVRPGSWAGQWWLDRGARFDDPDVALVPARVGIDPRAVYWIPGSEADDPLAGSWSDRPPGEAAR